MKIDAKMFRRTLVLVMGLPVLLFSDFATLCKDVENEKLKEIVRVHTVDLRQEKRVDINQDGIKEKVLLHPNMGSQVRLDEIEIYSMKGEKLPFEAYEPAAFTATHDLIAYQERYYVAHYADPDRKQLQYITYIDAQMHEKPVCILHADKQRSVEENQTAFQTVFQKNITLDAQTSALLQLKEEKTDQTLAEKPAKVLMDYDINGTKKRYLFTDTSKKFPILYFDAPTLNTKIDKRVNLVNRVNVFDTNDDGNNEIFVYGTSHYGGSGLVGKVLVFHKNIKGDIEKMGLIEARDNFEMEYLKKENIIVRAQFIWGEGEGHYGDKHHYQIDIYELNNHFRHIPLMTTTKKYNDFNRTVIEDNIDSILKRYKNNI